MRPIRPVGVILLLFAGTSPVLAQDQEEEDTSSGPLRVAQSVWETLSSEERAGWARPLSSFLVPGSGQLMGGHERGVLYLIADVFLWTRFISFQKEGTRERDRFRDLAFDVARRQFDPSERDTTFSYFEEMAKFVESGPFDSDPGPEIQPSSDVESFNGSIWELAKQTFFENPDSIPDRDSPEFQRALEFYQERAVREDFRWSWRNARIEQDVFRQTIRKSDEGFRKASQQLGLILANHLLSTVDAVISHRLTRVREGTEFQTMLWTTSTSRFDPAARVELSISF